jgi:hypothetical protein
MVSESFNKAFGLWGEIEVRCSDAIFFRKAIKKVPPKQD